MQQRSGSRSCAKSTVAPEGTSETGRRDVGMFHTSLRLPPGAKLPTRNRPWCARSSWRVWRWNEKRMSESQLSSEAQGSEGFLPLAQRRHDARIAVEIDQKRRHTLV